MQEIELTHQNQNLVVKEPKINHFARFLSLIFTNQKSTRLDTGVNAIRKGKSSILQINNFKTIKDDSVRSISSAKSKIGKFAPFVSNNTKRHKSNLNANVRSRATKHKYPSNNSSNTTNKRSGSSFNRLFSYLIKVIVVLVILVIPVYLLYVYFNLSTVQIEDPLANTETLVEKDEDLLRQIVIMTDENDSKVVGIYIFIFNQVSGESLTYYIPQWVYSDDYSNSFEQPVSVENLLYMASTINPENTYQFVINQISSVVGMIFDSYVFLPTDKASEITSQCKYDSSQGVQYIDDCLDGVGNPFNDINPEKLNIFISSLHTNLDYKQLMQLKNRISTIDFVGGNVFDLSGDNYVTQSTLPSDQSVVVSKLVVGSIDNILAENIEIVSSKSLQKELVKVEVYNGSGMPKYAVKYSRYINNMGCNVVRYGNADKEYDQTTIYIVDPVRFENSLTVVNAILGKDVVIINERPSFLTTGDIIIVLGKNVSTSR